jgi:hypothetical protein
VLIQPTLEPGQIIRPDTSRQHAASDTSDTNAKETNATSDFNATLQRYQRVLDAAS